MGEMVLAPVPPTRWGEVFTLQRAAFVDEAALYGTPDVPPLTEEAGPFRSRFEASTALMATHADRIVGAVFGVDRGDHAEVERLMVAPDCRRRGIASSLMGAIEERLATAGHERIRLVVGERAVANRRLYERLGYEAVERSLIFGDVAILIMEKRIS